MAEDNVDLARRGYEALNRAYRSGDVNDFLPWLQEQFHPEVVLAPAGVLPESRPVQGWDGVLRFMAEQMKAFEDRSMWLEPLEYIDGGDALVVPYRFGGRAPHRHRRGVRARPCLHSPRRQDDAPGRLRDPRPGARSRRPGDLGQELPQL